MAGLDIANALGNLIRSGGDQTPPPKKTPPPAKKPDKSGGKCPTCGKDAQGQTLGDVIKYPTGASL